MSCSAYGHRHLEKQQVSLLSDRCRKPLPNFQWQQAVSRRSIKICCYNSGSCCSNWHILCCIELSGWTSGRDVVQKTTKPLGFPVVLWRYMLREWKEGHPAHRNPVVVAVSLSFVRAPAHPGYPCSKGRKTVVHLYIIIFYSWCFICSFHSVTVDWYIAVSSVIN